MASLSDDKEAEITTSYTTLSHNLIKDRLVSEGFPQIIKD